jgi:hypothetical protein
MSAAPPEETDRAAPAGPVPGRSPSETRDVLALLRLHERQARGTWLLWSGAATLAAVALQGISALGWWPRAWNASLCAMAAAAVLLVVWFVRVARITPAVLARTLDQRWQLRGRLESTIECAADDSAWSRALRADASAASAGRSLPGAVLWRAGLLALGAVGLALLTEGSVIGAPLIRLPPRHAAPETVAHLPDFNVTMDWKSPDPEIQATAIEEVPLSAVIDSNVPLRRVLLETTVNGAGVRSQPLEPGMLERVARPGRHEVEPSVFLDELEVKPFDIVSYRLIAEVDVNGTIRTAASQPQLIQIRPARRDAGMAGGPSEFPGMLMELKSRQLLLLKQNAALGQLAANAATDPSWTAENDRVAKEQAALRTKAAELIAWSQRHDGPPEVKTALDQASDLMDTASREITARSNDAALPTQTRALALITSLEKFLNRALSGGSPAANPIPDDQHFTMPDRAQAPAGELEKLAAREQDVSAQLETGSGGPATDLAAVASEQGAIGADAAKLAGGDHYDAEVKRQLAEAAQAATDAAQQLKANDPATARLQTARAARALAQAVDTQDKLGRTLAVALLVRTRREANDAARSSHAGAALKSIGQDLVSAATSQQQTGSLDVARALADLAQSLSVTSASAKNDADRLRTYAMSAAHVQVMLSEHKAAVDRVLRQLRHGATGTGADSAAGADVQLVAQEAAWLSSDPALVQTARQLGADVDASMGGTKRIPWIDLSHRATELADDLEHGRGAEDGLSRRFDPANVDPVYRAAVASYFERLSRDAKRPPAAPRATATP